MRPCASWTVETPCPASVAETGIAAGPRRSRPASDGPVPPGRRSSTSRRRTARADHATAAARLLLPAISEYRPGWIEALIIGMGVVATLYIGADLLIPIALALLLSFVTQVWEVKAKSGDQLHILLGEIHLDVTEDLGIDPGLQKDGVEAHLQQLLAENPETFGTGWSLVQQEYMTPIGPVDLLCRNAEGVYVAVEIKRRGEIDGVEQLTRYLDLLNRDHLLGDHVDGVFAAQQIKPQARTLAMDRGIACVTVDYDALRGMDHPEDRLF